MSGFQNAGVTKGLMVALGISSLVVSLLDIKPYFHLQLIPHLTKYHQFWRILVHPFVFANSTELLMGELLLYHVGVSIERYFGSRKYASFALVSSIVSTVISFAVILLFHAFGIRFIPAGPYGLIFSLLWQHFRIVPALYKFRILSIEFSSKIFMWLLASQLILSHPPASMLAAGSGLLTGYFYRTDLLLLPSLSLRGQRHFRLRPLKTYRIPLSIHLLLSRILSPLFGSVPNPPRRANRTLPGQLTEAQLQASARASAIAAGLVGGAGDTNGGVGRDTLRRLLARGAVPPTPVNNAANGQRRTTAGVTSSNTVERETTGSSLFPGTPPVLASSGMAPAGGARAAMGEWVSEMTGRGAGSTSRVPTEDEIAVLRSMFPNLSREVVVRALQRSDHNTAQAVEALLEESG